MNTLMGIILRLYRRLLALYPAGYRRQFSAEMEEVFRLEVEERAESNGFRAFMLLLHEVRDFPLALWRAHQRERRLAVTGTDAAMNNDAQWAQLLDQYQFSYPASEWWFHWGAALSLLIALAVGAVHWVAGRAHPTRARFANTVARLGGTVLAVLLCFIPLTWLALIISVQVDEWIERF